MGIFYYICLVIDVAISQSRINKKTSSMRKSGVDGGTRTHDIQNHNLTL